jgi:hypothetical protein
MIGLPPCEAPKIALMMGLSSERYELQQKGNVGSLHVRGSCWAEVTPKARTAKRVTAKKRMLLVM